MKKLKKASYFDYLFNISSFFLWLAGPSLSSFPSVQRVHVRQDVVPAAHGHTSVPVLPEAQARVRREGGRHQGRDGDRQAGHRVEDQPGGARPAADQPAAAHGTKTPVL